jgi:predicted RND superfamily exporter protein
MVADDMMTFVRKDLQVFGTAMSLMLLLALRLIFRRWRWVVLPMLCCAVSVIIMMGLIGHLGWPVTVISSNFISLQLILTLALSIHLVVRFTELRRNAPEGDQQEIIEGTVRTKFIPCLFTTLTTIAGFSSLVMSDILPVIDFGWMMAVGLVVSLAVTFLIFPAGLAVMKPLRARSEGVPGSGVTAGLAAFADRRELLVLGASLLVVVGTVAGIWQLRVENSFIDYFRKSTAIYQGMKIIDDHLGGTTPLDIVVNFETAEASAEPAQPGLGETRDRDEVSGGSTGSDDLDAFDEFEEFEVFREFEEPAEKAKYWFTGERIQTIRDVHVYLENLPAVGNVLSLDSTVRVAEELTGGEPLDNFSLAVFFNNLGKDGRAELVDPYASIEHNQARVSARIRDSLPGLKRRELLEKIAADLNGELGLGGQAQIGGLLVLYNNMLQSLFTSQIQTAGTTMLLLWLMILVLFRSAKVASIALIPNLIASLSVLGVMGWLDLPLDVMTITVVAISIGIAIDHTIHYCHRFRQELLVDGDYHAAMFRSHRSVGSALLYTSATIIIGFSILALSNFIPSVIFGLLTALAMALAPILSLTLLPVLIIRIRPF